MLNRCLSPVLSDTLKSENVKDIIFSEVADAGMLKEYFAQCITQFLLRKERTIVIIPDQMDASIPSKILARENLAHYTCSFQRDDEIHPMLAERARLLAELKEIPLLRQEYSMVALKYKEIEHKIADTLTSLSRASIQSPSFKDMLLSSKEEPQVNLLPSALEEIAKVHLNGKSIDHLKSWQKSLDNSFLYLSARSAIDNVAFEDHESLNYAIEEISDLYHRMTENLIELETELLKIKQFIKEQIDNEVGAWTKIKEELQSAFFEHEVENFPTSFESRGMPIINKLRGFNYLQFQAIIQAEKGWGQVPQLLKMIDAIIAAAQSGIDTFYEDYLRKLSPFHSINPSIDGQIDLSLQLLSSINSSKYLNKKYRIKFLQVDDLVDILQEAQQGLLLAKKAITNEAYLNFKLDQIELNISDKLLQALYNIPADQWTNVIHYYGQKGHLTAGYDPSMAQLEPLYRDAKNTYLNMKHLENKEIHNRWCQERKETLTGIKNNKWDTYKAIFSKAESAFSFPYLVDQLSESLQTFFPIIVVHETDFKYAISHPNMSFDQAIFLDTKDVSITDISILNEKNINITIASSFNIDVSDLKEMYPMICNYCSDVRIEKTMNLSELEQTERYQYAVALAGLITNQVESGNIYKIGNRVLISLLDPRLEQKLMNRLGFDDGNLLYRGTKEIVHFVETIIHHDDIVLLTENNLLNDKKVNTTFWQRHVIEILASSGINILDVPTHMLYREMDQSIDFLSEQIQSGLEVSSPMESQPIQEELFENNPAS